MPNGNASSSRVGLSVGGPQAYQWGINICLYCMYVRMLNFSVLCPRMCYEIYLSFTCQVDESCEGVNTNCFSFLELLTRSMYVLPSDLYIKFLQLLTVGIWATN